MIEFKKVLVTPDYARQLLEKNTGNRRKRKPKMLQYANDMAQGKWKQNTAEPLKIAISGRVLDGQNRLEAVIISKTPCWFHIATGLEEDVFDVLDTGAVRNAPDVFKIANVKNDTTVPAIIAMYNHLVTERKTRGKSNEVATNAQLLMQYKENPEFWYHVTTKTINWYLSFAKILAPSFIGGFYSFLHGLNEEKAGEFMNQLCTGIGVHNKVILLLRNKLMQDKVSPRKMTKVLKTALVTKAWNYFVINESPGKILKIDSIRGEYPLAIKG